MSKFMSASVAALALVIGINGLAGATEYKTEYDHETKTYCKFEKVIRYKTVVEYRHERQEFTKWVVEYDHHHKPHRVKKVFHKDVEVPVYKKVAVVKWVKVIKDHGHGY